MLKMERRKLKVLRKAKTSTIQKVLEDIIEEHSEECEEIAIISVEEVVQYDATKNLEPDVIVHDTGKLLTSPAASSVKERTISVVMDTWIHTEVEEVEISPAEVLVESIEDASPKKSGCDVRIEDSQSEDIAREIEELCKDMSMKSDASREISHTEEQALEENYQQVNQSIREAHHGNTDNGVVLNQNITALAIVTDINFNNISNIKKNSPNKVLHDVVSHNVGVVEEENENIDM
ncbi:hypothetical protein K7X08_029798 [Anisodus acutangulus]|uniref:Uncharacterized protein n=1 Tax=Anisodus acutangulus TaxID=402998 RepID=A0A9Q1MF22_9SOLA|nr:hypothetical protein K7X08_029798 [Anisodus acutangulus]